MTKIKYFLAVVLALLAALIAVADVPEPMKPARLVNDFAEVFSPEQRAVLEDTLVRFSRRTSNQITVVTVADLEGQDVSMMAAELGEKWGVGGSKNNNGVVILMKPKNDNGGGRVAITTGYGLEGALPDAACKMIIEREMIPHFKQDDYYGGISSALSVIMPIAAKEYSIDDYANSDDDPAMMFIALAVALGAIILFIVLANATGKGGDNNDSNGSSGGGRTFGGPVIFGPGIGGSSSGFGSGGSGFGGFGGFGGGSFGGGGASGGW